MKVAHLSEPAEERVIFRDGLGVRERRETDTGEVVEWFHLHPAFAAAEGPLRERVVRLSKLQHVKFARILGLEPARKDAGPILVSTHVAGTRLADALEMGGHGLITFDAGAGLQVTREVLGALAVLHDSRNVAHGALGPERIILNGSGRVVMVEHVLAQALDRMQRPRHQLWREWRIATPPAAGPVRFDVQTDLAQAGVLALALLLGRPVDEEEYPHRLRGLLPLVQDRLAQSPAAAIAGEVVAWLERLAPVDSRRAFKTVREAQQAFEGLVSGGAAALGIAPSRVKGVLAAMAAISAAAPAPRTANSEAIEPPAPAVPLAVLPAAVTIATATDIDVPARAEAATDADADIDIEALLALEAELEGGTSPAVPASPSERPSSAVGTVVALPPEASAEPAPVADALALDALAQERLDLERQFAALVETVAPAEPPVVHLMPETPPTSESLVDARVRWSSMPVENVVERGAAPAVEDVTDAEPAPWAADEQPTAPPPQGEAQTDAEVGCGADAVGSEPPMALEPIVFVSPEERLPAASVADVPAGWWREALPWRLEATDAVDVTSEPLACSVQALAEPESEAAAEAESEAAPEAESEAAPDAESEAPASSEATVGENFGYLSLDDIEGRAAVVDPGEDDALVQDIGTVPALITEPDAFAVELAIVEPPVDADPLVSDQPATAECHDLAQDIVSPLVAHADGDPPFMLAAEPMFAERNDAARDEATDDVTPAAFASVFADVSPDDVAQPARSGRLFEDIGPILLQDGLDAEPVQHFFQAAIQPVDVAPLTAASSLLRRDASDEDPAQWRRALVGAGSDSESDDLASPAPAWRVTVEECQPAECPEWFTDVRADAAAVPDDDVSSEAEPATPAVPEPMVEPIHPEAPVDTPVLAPVAEPLVEEVIPADPPVEMPEIVPEVIIVDDLHHGDTWDDLPSERVTPFGATEPVLAPAAPLDEGRGLDEVAPQLAMPMAPVAVGTGSKKKRRRGRHKKEAPASVVLAPTGGVVPVPIAPVGDEEELDTPAASVPAALHVALATKPTSLLEREVPAWTPPADLGLRPARTPSLSARETATPPPDAVPPSQVHADSEGAFDMVATADPGLAPAPSRLAVLHAALYGPISAPMTVPEAMAAPLMRPAAVPSHEASRHADHEIRAVGMPDLDEVSPRVERTGITSMADAIGPAGSQSHWGQAESRGPGGPAPTDTRKGMDWRRVVAASVIIALFQGVAFAAWWWVQPGARGTLVVETGRTSVEVLVDDTMVGRTPFREEIAPGRHKLGLRQGRTIREMPVEITVGVVTTQAIDWPSSGGGKGSLQVSSSPAGAEIFVAGKSRGKAPQLLENLPAGDQLLMLRSDAGSVTVTATVMPDETTPVDVKIFAGWILVDAPVELNLLLNGRDKIGSSMDGQILMPPGPHRVQAVNDVLGIRQWLTVTVEPGAVERVPFTVQPGTLTLVEEAEVFIDGTSVGTTPGTVTIAPGTHDIAIRHPDGTERRQPMTVRAGQRVEF